MNIGFICGKYLKNTLYFCIIVFFSFFCFVGASTPVIVSLSIIPWQITYWSPTYLNLWQIDISPVQQETQWQFGDYFWVKDLGSSDTGYTTTIVSDWLIWPNWATLTWIYLMAGNNWGPELLLWVDWNVKINPVFSGSYYSIFSSPVTYIYRQQWANYWKINKYGDKPWIKVVTPGYMQPWTYSWTIYFDI